MEEIKSKLGTSSNFLLHLKRKHSAEERRKIKKYVTKIRRTATLKLPYFPVTAENLNAAKKHKITSVSLEGYTYYPENEQNKLRIS